MNNNIHPDIKQLPDFTEYDRIYVGFPAWWAMPPMIIHTLFEKSDLSDKNILGFITSMSTSAEEVAPTFKKLVTEANANYLGIYRAPISDRNLKAIFKN
ncbi:flavodoxin [Companilactobacillus metriopterae]|uniref:flavodoxin n=1 Tax=Companilactobacillus metriopterae TaxID=1909267 RepID=UPI00100B4730|nr:flavodoxin [Companilactobacillus metriopterae]